MLTMLFGLIATAHAGFTTLQVVVTDDAGKPIPAAIVRFDEEGGDRHRVNSYDGSWEAAALYRPDKTEVLIAKGQALPLIVSAPGYTHAAQTVTIEKKRTRLSVVLAPVVLDAPADASAEEAATYAAMKTWTAAEAAYLAQATTEGRAAGDAASQDAGKAAIAWLNTNPAPDRRATALDFCWSAAWDPANECPK